MLDKNDKIGIVTLFIFYFIQGIVLGIPLGALPILLVENTASLPQVGLVATAALPFSLKILWASFLDKFFIPSFGKRKTYIIPCHYIMAIMLFAYSFSIDNLIINIDCWNLAVFFFMLVFITATADIAVDGWVLTLFPQEKLGLGSSCQSAGQNMGWFISQFIFIKLNSVRFCNQFIFDIPRNEPLVSMSGYLQFWSLVTLVYTLIIHVFKSETNPDHKEFESLWDVYRMLGGFYSNLNLRYFSLVLLFFKLGFSPMDAGGALRLLQMGFSKDTLTTIGIVLFPIQVILPVVLGKYSVRNMEMKLFLVAFLVKFVETVALFVTVELYPFFGSTRAMVALIVLNMFAANVANTTIFVVMGAFFSKICDATIGGTFVTALASIYNFGKVYGEPLSLFLVKIVDFWVLVVIGLVYEAIFFALNRKKIATLQSIQKADWAVRAGTDYVEMTDASKA